MLASLARRRPLVLAALCYLAGAIVGSAAGVPALWWGAGLIPLSLLVFWKRGAAVFAALVLLAAAGAAARMERPMPAPFEGAALIGEVCLEPQADGERTVLTLSGAVLNGAALDWSVRVYAYVPVPARLGDRVEMTVDTWLPRGQINPYGFDFDAWCRMKNVLCATMRGETALVSPGAPSARTLLREVRAGAGALIDRSFPTDQAQLVRALLLGDRSQLPEALSDDFRDAGVAHILSVSGLHVTCLAFALDMLLRRFLSRRAVFCLMAALLSFYAALVGFDSPIVRSVVMYLVFRFAPIAGRPGDALSALAASMLILLAINPLQVYDAGFVLSFSAMAGLILLSRPLERLMGVGRWPRPLRIIPRTLAASLAASIAILPALAGLFGAVQPYGPLINVAAVPLATLALPLSALALALCAVFPAWSGFLTWLPSLLLRLLTGVTGFAAGLPGASMILGHIAWPLCALWAAALYAVSDHGRVPGRWKAALLAVFPAALALSLMLNALSMPGGLALDVLAAGDADAMVLYAEGQVYTVDAGNPGGPSARYLSQTGRALRAVFLTHPHGDHIGGAGELKALYPGITVYVPECWDRVPGVREAERRAGLSGPYVKLAAGDEVRLSGNVSASVLYPPRGLTPSDANDASLVLLIRYEGASALLMGDLGDASALPLIPDADLVKAPHHGEDIKGAELLLRAASPAALVVSVGGSTAGHPSAALVARAERLGAKVLRTDRTGMVRAVLAPGGAVAASAFLSPEEEP